ncbi:MAG: S8 family serine peptidase [Bacillus sp. (in: firmicutes)]
MLKRSLSIMLIFLLAFGTAAQAATLPIKEKASRDTSIKTDLKVTDELYKESDSVRVLVELKSEPAIEFATKKGVKFNDLASATKDKLHKNLLDEQEKVKSKIKEKKVNMKYKEKFTTVVNGFSAEMKYGNIKDIKSIDDVSNVYVVNEYERPEEKPEMIYSKELVQAQEAWRDYGYKGEGMVIGVIDTGIDPNHKDMVLSPETEEKFTKGHVNAAKEKFDLKGKFYTDKVPYGYNYMDKNDEILDLGSSASMHGMHVAGTAAANGNEEEDGILGVAPEAQVLALKVFGNDPEFGSTYGDIYVKAIDDSINLGADVLNLSLGSIAGFVDQDNPEQQAVTRATENGIMVAISGGNSAHFGNGYSGANPYASNPDIGLSGAPGVSYDSLQVSSIENNYIALDAVSANVGGDEKKYPFMSASAVDPTDIERKPYGLVDAGLGGTESFEGKDFTGKFALVARGTYTFIEKAMNAQNAGAAGVIIYNNTNGFMSMASDAGIRIPQLAMLKTDGEELKAALAAGEEVSLVFEGEKETSPNPEAGKMSSFTSWGVTPNLDFKPEITAPGGNIYSTLNDNKYGMMSGTSMAAPHVAGGSALVLQRVDEDFNLEDRERVNISKNILMNTSAPVLDKGTVNTAFDWEVPYSPRRQGSGLMQLHAALETPVVVTEKSTKEAKVALKEVGDTFNFELEAKNYSEEDVTYNVDASIQTDLSVDGELGYSASVLEAQKLENVELKVNGADTTEVTIPAGQTVNITVQADLTDAKVVEPGLSGDWSATVDPEEAFPNGYFVEGFVTFEDITDTNPVLTVPYVGFKGEWDNAPVVDPYANDPESFYGYTGLLNEKNEYLGFNSFAKDIDLANIAISPNGDGVNDQAIPVISLLRNAKTAEFNILDKNGKQLRKLRTEKELRKHYYNSGSGALYSISPLRSWNGKVNNKIAEGDYFYEIKSTIDYEGASPQSFKIPVKVDITEPAITASKEEQVIRINAKDNENGSGIASITVLVNNEEKAVLPPGTEIYELEGSVNSEVKVVAADYAGNTAEAVVEENAVNPEIHLIEPAALDVYNSKEVALSGYVINANGQTTVTVAGQEMELTYNAEKKYHEFKSTLSFEEDGVHEFTVTGNSYNGKEYSFNRSVIIDSTAPVIEVMGAPETVGLSAPNPTVDVKVEDNFDELRVQLNGDEIFYHEFKGAYEMRPISETIEDLELPLEPGENTFEFVVVDFGGNETVKTITIQKLDTDEQPVPQQGTIDIQGKKATLTVDGEAIEKDITDQGTTVVMLNMSRDVVKNEAVSDFKAELDLATAKKMVQNKKGVTLLTGGSSLEVSAASFEAIVKKSVGKVTISSKEKAVTGIGKNSFLTSAYEFKMDYQSKGLFGKTTTVPVVSLNDPAVYSITVAELTEAEKKKVQAYRQIGGIWTKEGGQATGERLNFQTKTLGTFAGK